jgi:hypothetical protein
VHILAVSVEQLTRPEVPWPVVLGIVIMTTGLIMRGRRRRACAQAGATRSVPAASRGNRQHVEDELRQLLLELERLAREVEAQIEVRHRKLEVSIRTADERIARLEQLLARAGETPPIAAAPSVPADSPAAICEFSA